MEHKPLLSDLTAGELSPYLYGMPQQPVYHKGASKIQNFVPKALGGFYKRPGTLLCGHTKSDLAATLVPFVINQSTAYVLEFTNNLIRVWKDGVYYGATIADIVTTYTTAEIPNLQFATFFPDIFITHQNHAPARIRWASAPSMTLTTLTYRTDTISITADLTNTNTTILNIKDTNGNPFNLLPTEATWLISGVGVPANTYLKTVTPTTGSSPLAYQAVMNNAASATNTGVALTLTLQPIPFGSSGNYPKACQVSFQRLWFMNTGNNPQTIWQSIVGIYDSTDPGGTTGIIGMSWSDISTFSVPILQANSDGSPTTNPPTYLPTATFQDQINDADAGSYTLNSPRDDEILWAVPMVDLFVGSAYGEWIIPGASNPNTLVANQISAVTDFPVPPVLVSGGVLLIQKLGKRVFRIEWQGINNPYFPPQDITFFSEHMFANNPIVDYDIQLSPDRLLWYMRTDGTIAVVVYDHTMGVIAWWNWVTTGTVVSLAVVPGADLQGNNDRDVMYLCVQRGGKTYVEQVATPYWTDTRQAIFSDCATYKFNATAFKTMAVDTGLNGQTLEVVADGAYIGTATVVAGVLTLPGGVSANYAVCGMNYVSTVTSMPLLAQSAEGSGQLQRSAIPRSRFRVVNTLYMKAGQFTTPNAGGLSPLSNVKMGDTGIGGKVLSSTVPSAPNPTPYSGFCRSSILEALRDDAYISIVSDLPLPCAVSAIVPDVSEVESGK